MQKNLPYEIVNKILEYNQDSYIYVKIPKNYSIWNEVHFYKKNGYHIPENHLKQKRYLMNERKNLKKLIENDNSLLSQSIKPYSVTKYDEKILEAMLYIIQSVISKHLYCSSEKLNLIANIYLKDISKIFDKRYIIYKIFN